MSYRRTLELTAAQRQELIHHHDHDPQPYVRERCAALLKIAAGHPPLYCPPRLTEAARP